MRSTLRKDQSGLTILGFLLVAAVVVIFAMVGFRVVPSYVEYYAVKRSLDDTMRSGTADPNNPLAFRNIWIRPLAEPTDYWASWDPATATQE